MKSKVGMIMGSVSGAFLLVYGTAFLFHLLFGSYLLVGGLANMNYGLLALFCAVPFVIGILAGRSRSSAITVFMMSSALFAVLFVLVHLVLVLSAGAMEGGAVTRTLLTFPVSAICLVGALYFTARNEKAS